MSRTNPREPLKIAANISLLFGDLPLLARFAAARDAGFDGVEIQFPYAASPGALQRAAQDAAMPVLLMNAPIIAGTYPAGIAARPEMRREFRAQLPMICEYADALDVRFVHVLAGRCADAAERDRCRDTYVENLCIAAAALAGRQVLIEALNPLDVPDYLIGSCNAAQAILAHCADRVHLQFDAYHVARMGLDPCIELARLLPWIRHIQFADAPGRHEPGTGTIAFEPILKTLRAARYAGWLGAEYLPTAATAAGLGWLRQWRE